MKVLLLLIVLVAGGALVWYGTQRTDKPAVEEMKEDISSGTERMKNAVKDGLSNISLDTEQIKEELSRSGTVVRKKAKEIGTAIADATADGRTTATIKGKFVADPNLSALDISVNTTAGVVTLSGSVATHEEIGKAMKLALETDGVQEVVSTLQVRNAKPKE